MTQFGPEDRRAAIGSDDPDEFRRVMGELIPCYRPGNTGCVFEDEENADFCGETCWILHVYQQGRADGAHCLQKVTPEVPK